MVETRRSPERARAALAKRRGEADARAKDHIEILRASAARRRHQSVADALERILVRGSEFLFATVADIFRPQPWAISSDGELLGHLLTVDDATFDSVAEECLVELLTLPEALDRHWADIEQRSVWAAAYVGALRALADHEERRDTAVRDHDALSRSTAPAGQDPSPGQGPRF